MWLAYQIVLTLLLVCAAPIWLLRRGGHDLALLRGRLGAGEAPPPRASGDAGDAGDAGPLWIHAVSVGEVNVARTLLEDLPDDLPLLLTTVTPTGQRLARELAQRRAALRVAYLPFDLAPPLRRFLRRERPRALILMESEYWPLLQRMLRRRGVPIYVVNARVSDRTWRRQRRVLRWAPALLRPLFGPVTRFCTQTEVDAERLAALGAPRERIVVTGNLKFEQARPRESPEASRLLEQVAGGRPVVVAGSTMPGEDEVLLRALAELAARRRDVLLVLAPRHPERWDSVAEAVRRAGFPLVRR